MVHGEHSYAFNIMFKSSSLTIFKIMMSFKGSFLFCALFDLQETVEAAKLSLVVHVCHHQDPGRFKTEGRVQSWTKGSRWRWQTCMAIVA